MIKIKALKEETAMVSQNALTFAITCTWQLRDGNPFFRSTSTSHLFCYLKITVIKHTKKEKWLW